MVVALHLTCVKPDQAKRYGHLSPLPPLSLFSDSSLPPSSTPPPLFPLLSSDHPPLSYGVRLLACSASYIAFHRPLPKPTLCSHLAAGCSLHLVE